MVSGLGLGLRVWLSFLGLGFWDLALGFWVKGFGIWLRVLGLWFRVLGFGVGFGV